VRIELYVVAGLIAADSLSYLWLIGKPHRHTAGGAVLSVSVAAFAVVALVMAAGNLR
jgi:hypothetical protein